MRKKEFEQEAPTFSWVQSRLRIQRDALMKPPLFPLEGYKLHSLAKQHASCTRLTYVLLLNFRKEIMTRRNCDHNDT